MKNFPIYIIFTLTEVMFSNFIDNLLQDTIIIQQMKLM